MMVQWVVYYLSMLNMEAWKIWYVISLQYLQIFQKGRAPEICLSSTLFKTTGRANSFGTTFSFSASTERDSFDFSLFFFSVSTASLAPALAVAQGSLTHHWPMAGCVGSLGDRYRYVIESNDHCPDLKEKCFQRRKTKVCSISIKYIYGQSETFSFSLIISILIWCHSHN